MKALYTANELKNVRQAGQILARIFDGLKKRTKPDVSEKELDTWVESEIIKAGGTVAYKTPAVNFPGAICISVNDEIVHSPPTDYVLQTGDVVSFDLVVEYRGMNADSAFTMVVGEQPTGKKKHLLNTTERALYAGLDVIKGPTYTGTIGAAIEKVLKGGGLGIVRELAGHGVGRKVHEKPSLPNYGSPSKGELIKPGQIIAVEPMAMLGKDPIKQAADGWTYATKDGSLAAHFEHTVLVTEDGYEILTK